MTTLQAIAAGRVIGRRILNESKRHLCLSATPVETPVLFGGRWNGHPLDLAAMEEMVATYNPEAQEAPIKLTHVEDQKRAYGWVKSLRIGDWVPPGFKSSVKTLFAKLSFTDEGRQAVTSGAYRMKSIEAWPRDHPSNPTPGKWNFRALALLGAESPGCPNLSPLTLSAGDDEPEVPVLVLQAGEPLTHGGDMPPTPKGPVMTLTPEQVTALQAQAAKAPELEAQLAALQAQLASQAETSVQSRLDAMVQSGKLTPAQASIAKHVVLSVPDDGVVQLAEGKNGTRRDGIWALLDGMTGHGLLELGKVPHTHVSLQADTKNFDATVKRYVDAGKSHTEALELAAAEHDR